MNIWLYPRKPFTNAGRTDAKILMQIFWKRFANGLERLSNFLLMMALPASGVTLTWNPSPSPDVAGYNVYSGVVSGIYSSKLTVGKTPTATIGSLTPGNTYYFCVTAYNNAGAESPPSNEVQYEVSATDGTAPIVLGGASLSSGRFYFSIPAGSGTWVAVQSSVDLVHWVSVLTNLPPFTFVETNASPSGRNFYRTITLPDFKDVPKSVPANDYD
ncbi:MAG TPA: fibronectin type III domain-containing protein [Candidatus Acidoferrales bacterium]|nr:fibronectin type III domain-containing protein [Candidatus Acidoferrales bacterium]